MATSEQPISVMYEKSRGVHCAEDSLCYGGNMMHVYMRVGGFVIENKENAR